MKVVVHNKKLEPTDKKVDLSDSIWKARMNEDLVGQAIHVYASNRRQGTASAKTRGMVQGGGRKPWKQKGTGRARAGSIRSPLWVGGGVTFPPSQRNWSRKMNKKMKLGALSSVLSQMIKDGGLLIVETKGMDKGSFKENEKYMIVTESDETYRKVRNLKNVKVVKASELNALIALEGGKVCFDVEELDNFEKRFASGR